MATGYSKSLESQKLESSCAIKWPVLANSALVFCITLLAELWFSAFLIKRTKAIAKICVQHPKHSTLTFGSSPELLHKFKCNKQSCTGARKGAQPEYCHSVYGWRVFAVQLCELRTDVKSGKNKTFNYALWMQRNSHGDTAGVHGSHPTCSRPQASDVVWQSVPESMQ